MGQIMTSHHLRACPQCNGTEFVKDYKRSETYCNTCGLVITSAVQYVGLEKISNVVPFSAPTEARNTINHNWLKREDRGRVDNKDTTNYRHRYTNRQLMIR